MSESNHNYYKTQSFDNINDWKNYINLVSNLKLHSDDEFILLNNKNNNNLNDTISIDSNSIITDTQTNNNCIINNNKSLLYLLLNYFIIQSYEDSSIKLAKELNLIKNNIDLKNFINFFKINERKKIIKLIKSGNIIESINLINKFFDIQFLNNNIDLYFKLSLLNLIEMIRSHNLSNTENKDKNNTQFIIDIIKYTQSKLSSKASLNINYMKQLELVITLLLYPHDDTNNNLPPILKNLFSLSLRSKIADLVNKKLLTNFIYPNLNDDTNFKILLNFNPYLNLINNNGISSSNDNNDQEEEEARDFNDILNTDKLNDIKNDYSNNSNSNYWNNTSSLLEANTDTPLITNNLDNGLLGLFKIWIWTENLLHKDDIGIPRI